MNDGDNGEMRWFGESWGSGLNEDCDQQPTPVGEACLRCEEPIAEGDAGVTTMCMDERGARRAPHHLECWLRILFGSVAHQERRCSCFGGDEGEEDPTLTKREAAKLAVKRYYREKFGN